MGNSKLRAEDKNTLEEESFQAKRGIRRSGPLRDGFQLELTRDSNMVLASSAYPPFRAKGKT